jgi:ubiquinone biosynthesis protein COQ4
MNSPFVNLAQGLNNIAAALYHLHAMLKTIKAVLILFSGSNEVGPVYDIEDGLKHTGVMKYAVNHMLSQPGVVQIALSQYIAPIPYLEALKLLPPGTLGREYAEFVTRNGFDPNFFRKMQIQDISSYLLLRLRQTHDIWHVVTGFDVNVPDEIGLKAFELAQTRRPVAGVLVTGGFIKSFLASKDVNIMLAAIGRGYRMGLQSQPLLAQKWEDQWEKPLIEIRTELGILHPAQ